MPDPTEIPHWRRIDSRTTTSGQPSEAQLAKIAALGVTHVINLGLHTHEIALPYEAVCVAVLGMDYVHIPVVFDAPTEQDFRAFCAVMAVIGDTPVHVHCIANMRVSAFFYRYRRDVLGLDDGLARAAMDSVWQPGGVWASFIGDTASSALPHRPPRP
jgi:protein tyrosine phosphatase (PTP) superfamily phosphohydrolase (DUF442 family)